MNHQIQTILGAAHFAAERHASQRRKGAQAEPYINHLIEVAHLVSTALSEPDPNLVVAALLHDTVEDAGVTETELIEGFGADVAALVLEVSDNKSLPKEERKRLQIVNASKKSVRAQTLTMADKLSNLRSILSSPPVDWNEERQREYFAWADRVVDGFSSPNPRLKNQLQETITRFQSSTGTESAATTG